jgi:hypothetical protein
MTVLADIRDWWRHRNDPPPPLPDRVTWTAVLGDETPDEFVDRANIWGDRTSEGDDKWHLQDVLPSRDGLKIRLVRTDGAFRWRDDGYRGF